MPRAISDATKLRKERRENKILSEKYSNLWTEVMKRHRIGDQMANVCYNFSQDTNRFDNGIDPATRSLLDGLRKEWELIHQNR